MRDPQKACGMKHPSIDIERQIEFDFLRATEIAALNTLQWLGKGQKELADAAACDAIRGMFDLIDMRGEIAIGEGIKDEAPGLFKGERVGTWREGAPHFQIALDPIDGTTNVAKGMPNSLSCIAAVQMADDGGSSLLDIPAFYMKKLAYPLEVRQAWIKDPSLPIDVDAPIGDVIEATARILGKEVRDVSVGQETYNLPDPFFTIATQNPIEQEGTYPLPEAQLDRFMFNIKVGYPTASEEEQILMATTRAEKPEVRKVLSGRAIVNIQKLVGSVAVSEYVVKYVARLVRATRPKDPQAPAYVTELVDWGAGPRAGQFLIQGGKAMAAMDGRFSVSLDDVRRIAVPVLRHRIATNFQAQADGLTSESIIERLLREIPEPEIPKLVK
jgi:hypothetical protein